MTILHVAGRLSFPRGAVVVRPRFRPGFPGALDDLHASFERCRRRGPVMVAGEGLGAGIAAALLLRLRDEGAALPRCAVLVSALLDLAMDAPSLLLNQSADPEFDAAALRASVAAYAGNVPLGDPRISALHANLHGLPPLLLLAAGTDPLLDDSLAFAARAARSGVAVDLCVSPDAGGLRLATRAAMASVGGQVTAPAALRARIRSHSMPSS
ncbi:alpha/beta hydrolase fold domain-containing protein [Actinomadura barringtoniae]|uniref:Alpha/beta hydrolase fold domain-containing protein n=1 Tax=Actinomadura barringtoniae TaxID=1427535 RepID=A0A939T5Y7_9ACTN|nr:alpha/beta hydrolase fold domain-containing protein [Actinomadura barringtoniae]MBO2447652.1 alpha/beta hydrolase fold domain-containing protein [Actinomadura barringtoniae]